MAEAVIGPLVGKLLELAASEANTLAEVDNEIRVLRDNLVWLQAFVRETDPKRRANVNELVAVRVQQSRDIAFDAEDAVDLYLVRLALARGPGWLQALLKQLLQAPTRVLVRHDLSKRVKRINKRLDQLTTNKDLYHIDTGKVDWSNWRCSAAGASRTTYDDQGGFFVGRDQDARKLKEKLLNINPDLSVLAISGDSGVGKSTLAKEIIKDHDIQDRFQFRFSICLPPFLDAKDILFLIGDQLKQRDEVIRNDVRDFIFGKLKNKRFLIVVEGAITTTNWNVVLSSALPNDQIGSRVVLIARLIDGDIRHVCDDHQIIKLLPLDHKNSMDIFYSRVFGDFINEELVTRKSAVEDYDKDIGEILGGLPLAIVLLAGLLRSKEFPGEWKAVIKQLKDNEQRKRIGRILSLCFDDLPHQLKSCFLYIPALTENGLLNAQRLVRLWIAEGFIRPEKGKTMEEVGQDYLKDFISRGLVQLESKDKCGNIKYVTIHNSIYSFAQFEAQEANFLVVHDSDEVLAPSIVRRLSLQNYMDQYIPITNSFHKLRSILCDFQEESNNNEDDNNQEADQSYLRQSCMRLCGAGQSDMLRSHQLKPHTLKFLQGSPFLRVIDFRGLKTVEKLPDEIGSMVHLRYLGMKSKSLKELPSSIGDLKYLQTLDLRDSGVKELPQSLWKVSSLRHILGPVLVLPNEVGELEHLQSLTTVCPPNGAKGSWLDIISPLENMNHLRYLHMERLNETHTDALSNAIKKLVHLTSLDLQGEVLPSSILTSTTLICLRELIMRGPLNKPDALSGEPIRLFQQLPNLTMLSLLSSAVPQEFIDKLAKLLFLSELEFLKNSYTGTEMKFLDGGFTSLKRLKLHHLNVKEVRIGSSAMLKLESLDVAASSSMGSRRITVIHTHPNIDDIQQVREKVELIFVDESNGQKINAH